MKLQPETFEGELAEEGTPLAVFQKERTDAIWEMFEGGSDTGIYPTSKFFYRLDKCVADILKAERERWTEEIEEYYDKSGGLLPPREQQAKMPITKLKGK